MGNTNSEFPKNSLKIKVYASIVGAGIQKFLICVVAINNSVAGIKRINVIIPAINALTKNVNLFFFSIKMKKNNKIKYCVNKAKRPKK